MRVLRIDRLVEFGRRHADARKRLAAWLALAQGAGWKSLHHVRQTYPHADGVSLSGGRTITVFNIKGHRYRLVTAIDYALEVVNVLRVMTHAEYDREAWK